MTKSKKPDTSQWIPPNVAMLGNHYAAAYQKSAMNLATFDNWMQLFYTAAVNCFEWNGLPEEIDPVWLERQLFLTGTVAFTRVTGMDMFIAGGWAAQGRSDIYGNPNSIMMDLPNGLRFKRHCNHIHGQSGTKHPTAVIGYDSNTRIPKFGLIANQCRRLANMDDVVDQHVNAQRSPFIISVPEESRKNAEKWLNSVMSGQPAIITNDAALANLGVQVFESGKNYNADRILNDRLKIVSEVYTLLGIDSNAAAEKKERVQTAETEANNEQFLIQRNDRLNSRLEICRRLEEVFGLEVTVQWSAAHPTMIDTTLYGYQEGGV